MAPKQTDPQFKLRLPPSLKDALEEASRRNNRSMSAEILARLQGSLEDENSDNRWDRKIAELDRKQNELREELDRLLSRPKD